MLLFTEPAGRNALVNTTTVWPEFPLVGTKANGYSAQPAADVNCAGSPNQLGHVIVIAMQVQNLCCCNE
jgi:hypothetical protein